MAGRPTRSSPIRLSRCGSRSEPLCAGGILGGGASSARRRRHGSDAAVNIHGHDPETHTLDCHSQRQSRDCWSRCSCRSPCASRFPPRRCVQGSSRHSPTGWIPRSELGELTLHVFPRLHAVGTGLAIHHKGRRDVPPLISADNIHGRCRSVGLMAPARRATSGSMGSRFRSLPASITMTIREGGEQGREEPSARRQQRRSCGRRPASGDRCRRGAGRGGDHHPAKSREDSEDAGTSTRCACTR